METVYLRIEKKNRGGKIVTILEGFTRRPDEIKELARKIKVSYGTGGTVKENRIEIQGDFHSQISVFLQKLGFPVKGHS